MLNKDTFGFMMIFVLVKLSRFVTPKEQDILVQDLNHQFRDYSNKVIIRNDPWGSRYRILISNVNSVSLTEGIIDTILLIPGVNNVTLFQKQFFETRIDTLSQLIKILIEYIRSKTDHNVWLCLVLFRIFKLLAWRA